MPTDSLKWNEVEVKVEAFRIDLFCRCGKKAQSRGPLAAKALYECDKCGSKVHVKIEAESLELDLRCNCGGKMQTLAAHIVRTLRRYVCLDCDTQMLSERDYPYIEHRPVAHGVRRGYHEGCSKG